MLTPKKQKKIIKNKTSTGCFSFYVYIFNLLFGFNCLISLAKWWKFPSVKPLSDDLVAIHNRELIVYFSWLQDPIFLSFTQENKCSTQANAEREKNQLKQVNTIGISPFHNIVVFEILHIFWIGAAGISMHFASIRKMFFENYWFEQWPLCCQCSGINVRILCTGFTLNPVCLLHAIVLA